MEAQRLAFELFVIKTFGQRLDLFELVGKAVEDFHNNSCCATL
jgi:hypothetical protein